ncbi:hypothetical protein KJA15_01070 [Patescibacteria group bacterium]|nr:hypothetical protein [Patescibacteria group bacterium]
MKLLTALKNTFRAIVEPNKAFKKIKNEDSLSPLLVVPFLAALRILYILLHILVVHYDVFRTVYSSFFDFLRKEIVLTEGLLMAYWFFLVSVGLYIFAKIFRKNPNYKAIEIGVFYIMLTPIFLIPFDIPHLLLYLYNGTGATYLFGPCFHTSLVMILIIVPIQFSYLFERFYGIKKRYTILPSIIFPVWIKYLSSIIWSNYHLYTGLVLSSLALLMVFFYIKKMKKRLFLILSVFIYGAELYYFRIWI